jgi:hypothetical protein
MTREKSTLQPSEARWQKHLPYWNGVRVRGTLLYVRQSGLSFSLLSPSSFFSARLLVCKVPGRTDQLSVLLFDHPSTCLLSWLSYCGTACLSDRLPAYFLMLPARPTSCPACLTTFLFTYCCCLPERLVCPSTVPACLFVCLSLYYTCLLDHLFVNFMYLSACPFTYCTLVPITSCLFLSAYLLTLGRVMGGNRFMELSRTRNPVWNRHVPCVLEMFLTSRGTDNSENQFHDGINFSKESFLWNRCLS